MNPTPIQQKLDRDFAALFGPSQPQHLPPQGDFPMDERRMSNPPKFSGDYKPEPRSSAQRELDIFLLQVDRNMGKILAVVIVVAFVCAFVFAKPGDPAYALMQWVLQ